jgi:hypothetical protein
MYNYLSQLGMMRQSGQEAAMKRLWVDFNTLPSAPVDLVKIVAPGSAEEHALPPLRQGERVLLFDADGLEVEAIIIHDSAGWWLALPDAPTWRDTAPASDSTPTLSRP